MSRPLLLGHRGARARKAIPENTLPSFDQALADGCDGFEFDVRRSGDGQAVVCHDPSAGGLEISAATTQQLPGLPRLNDVIERFQQNAFLDIEVKVSGLEETLLTLLRRYPPTRGFVVSSFLAEVLHAVRAVDPDIPLGVICETRAELGRWRNLPVAYVLPHQKLLSLNLLKEMKAAGRKVVVWTVNQCEDMKRFAEWGVEGIISDDTRLLVKALKK